VTAALLFLIGVALGATLNALWDWVVELFEISREQR
jgi:hypothetical protein